jgi:hypothetical protein
VPASRIARRLRAARLSARTSVGASDGGPLLVKSLPTVLDSLVA